MTPSVWRARFASFDETPSHPTSLPFLPPPPSSWPLPPPLPVPLLPLLLWCDAFGVPPCCGAVPRIGFGTAGLGDATEESANLALAAGYRHIDTAQVMKKRSKYYTRRPQPDPLD